MLTLPEALMLLALHDAKGTVHSAAFLALDPALRAATLAELRLRGHLQTRATGEIRRKTGATAGPPNRLVDEALAALPRGEAPGSVADWLGVLEKAMPDVRDRCMSSLTDAGVLEVAELERANLPDAVTYLPARPEVEAQVLQQLLAGVESGPSVTPRIGTLLALTVACHLEAVVFDKGTRAAARSLADWVAERDAVVRAVREQISRIEGE